MSCTCHNTLLGHDLHENEMGRAYSMCDIDQKYRIFIGEIE
jgi:hypothetical protein